MIRTLFCGDVMAGGVIPYNKNGYIDRALMQYMRSFDFRIGTLECAVGTNLPYDEEKMRHTKGIVYMRNEDFFRVKEMGFDVMSLANNHSTDLGEKGLINTIQLLEKNNILHCGAGLTLDEAKKPAVLSKDGITIAIIGCLFKGVAPTIFHPATDTEYGVFQTTIEEIEKDIKDAKNKYDQVIVMPHWGEEHSYIPPLYCKNYAKRMIEAGADLIIGDHPHIINPVVSFNGKECYFSLGNFLFPDRYLEVPRPTFYPDLETENKSYKRVWNFPKSIDEPVLSVHRGHNRVGMAVEAKVKKAQIKTNYRLVALGSDNYLRPYKCVNEKIKRFRMLLFGWCVKSPAYPFIRHCYTSKNNYIRRAVHKLSNFFNIVYDIAVKVD